MAKDFLNLVNCFNLTQSVCGPTHEKGHTLDLVLSYGLHVHVKEICKTCISDHLPVLYTITVPGSIVKPATPARCRRIINSQTLLHFSDIFKDSVLYNLDCIDVLSADELICLFNCTSTLDSVAPLRTKCHFQNHG